MIEKLPLISVVVPTYREEKYIEDCLKSVRKQDYEGKVEIIVVDSSSPDKTREIARKYVDKVINIKGRGIGKARNIGVKHSQGKILFFVNADTILSKDCIKKSVEFFKKEDVVAVVPSFHAVLGSYWGRLIYRLSSLFVKLFIILKKPLIPGECVGYRKDLFESCKGFRENMAVCEDLDLSLRVSKHGKCIYVGKTWVNTSSRRVQSFGNILINLKSFVERFILHKNPSRELYHHVEEIPNLNNLFFILNELYSYRTNFIQNYYELRILKEQILELKYRIKRTFEHLTIKLV